MKVTAIKMAKMILNAWFNFLGTVQSSDMMPKMPKFHRKKQKVIKSTPRLYSFITSLASFPVIVNKEMKKVAYI